jgi:Zn-dependent metalloprotease
MLTRKIVLALIISVAVFVGLATSSIVFGGNANAAVSQKDVAQLLSSMRGPTGTEVQPVKGESARASFEDGYLRALGAPAGHYFPVSKAVAGNPTVTAKNFIAERSTAFGVKSKAVDFAPKKSKKRGGRSYERFQQTYSQIPVFGAEVVIQLNVSGGVEYVVSDIMRETSALDDGKVSTVPTIPAADAKFLAIELMAEKHPGLQLDSSDAQLMIYQPAVVGNSGSTRLVWQTVVVSVSVPTVNEFILIDAHTGEVALHYTQIMDAMNREIYDSANTSADPGTLKRSEGGPATGITDVDTCYDYFRDIYNFYFNEHGRDSINNAGMTLSATVRICPSGYPCPYQNAFWNGSRMYFGAGFVADDVTAHELTHGVTQYESNLLYLNESGAINESFSDMWGEWVDLTNSAGNDDPSVRWLCGEDIAGIGAIRNMANPPEFGDPDRKGSPLWYTGGQDNGGVHTNSGVGNKLCYLLTDGDMFNYRTIFGMDISKTADLMYECQTNLLTNSADYEDLGDALIRAAANFLKDSKMSILEYRNVIRACGAVEIVDIIDYLPITFDQDYYNCNCNIGILVNDLDLAGSGSCDVNLATSGGDSETVILSEVGTGTGKFTGSIRTGSGNPVIGDGVIQVADGQTITGTYYDANDGTGNPAEPNVTATVDCIFPVISDVNFKENTAWQVVTFQTNELTTARIICGTSCDGASSIVAEDGPQISHTLKFGGMEPNTYYYFKIEATDQAGNMTTDSNNGNCYKFLAKYITVPTDYNTIQEAINAAEDGNVVVVLPGTYHENVICYKRITIRSIDPNNWDDVNATVIVGNGTTNTVYFGFGGTAHLNGFTVTGGTCGVYCIHNSSVISNCIIRNNSNTGVTCISQGGSPIVRNCIIRGNNKGIKVSDGSGTVKNSVICGNVDGVVFENGGGPISNCTIANNSSHGVVAQYGGTTISDSIIWDNGDDILGNRTVSYSCISICNDAGGTNNICGPANNPRFIDDNYHICIHSPCVNRGNPGGNYTDQVDIDGEPRIIGAYVDMGADEVNFPLPNPLPDAHWWKLDETSGTIADDSVGNSDGYFNGSNPHWVRGLMVDLNGVSDYFSVPSLDTAYNFNSTFSVAGWFKTSQSTGKQTIVGQWSHYTPAPVTLYFGWQVLVENKKVIARFGQGGPPSDITGTIDVVTDPNWHHFVLVYPTRNSNAVLYVDGNSQGTPGKKEFAPAYTKFRIGDGSYKVGNYTPVLKGGPFKGMIDDVMIFQRTLSPEEVEQLYHDGACY